MSDLDDYVKKFLDNVDFIRENKENKIVQEYMKLVEENKITLEEFLEKKLYLMGNKVEEEPKSFIEIKPSEDTSLKYFECLNWLKETLKKPEDDCSWFFMI